MKLSLIVLPFAALAMVPAAAHAEDAKPAADKSAPDYIPFANHGGVRDWRAEDHDTIYFQDRKRRWYKAELVRPAFELPSTIFLGLDTEPGDRLDKWSTLYIEGERYQLSSFERIEGQPPKRKKKARSED